MRKFKKAYQIELTLLGPVFIGSGEILNSKEYVFRPRGNKIQVMDAKMMFKDLIKLGLGNQLEKYMVDKSDKTDLLRWFDKMRIKENTWKKWVRYDMSAGSAVLDYKSKNNINLCIKSPYGEPYIPGTSLKGALKNIIFSEMISSDSKLKKNIQNKINRTNSNRRRYLSREERQLIEDTEKYLNMDDIIIRDSEPLSTDCLVLSKKRDLKAGLSPDRKSELNLVRECIKPGTKVKFDVIIGDEFPYSIEDIENMMNKWFKHYSDVFLSKFKYKTKGKPGKDAIMYLGGGTGFVSKTIMYSVFDGREAVTQTMKVFEETIGKHYRDHKHYKDDKEYKISPHMVKITELNKENLEFGMCKLSSVKEI